RPGLNRDVEKDDQKRVATARDAIISGADHVVIGRPISTSADPLYTVRTIQEEIAMGLDAL
ncbi:MAG TPA: orotidine-5'-phosphate decarboxylase, partial [Desulfobacteraceae bacterium]|nr:orotidine-5'-phosphate decarboxylase [Desulfobacteraceae bacterium]